MHNNTYNRNRKNAHEKMRCISVGKGEIKIEIMRHRKVPFAMPIYFARDVVIPRFCEGSVPSLWPDLGLGGPRLRPLPAR